VIKEGYRGTGEKAEERESERGNKGMMPEMDSSKLSLLGSDLAVESNVPAISDASATDGIDDYLCNLGFAGSEPWQRLAERFAEDPVAQRVQREAAVRIPLSAMAGAIVGAGTQHWQTQGRRRGLGFLLGTVVGLQVGMLSVQRTYQSLDPEQRLLRQARAIVRARQQQLKSASSPVGAQPSPLPSPAPPGAPTELLTDEQVKQLMMQQKDD
jgi:hypothetical protein